MGSTTTPKPGPRYRPTGDAHATHDAARRRTAPTITDARWPLSPGTFTSTADLRACYDSTSTPTRSVRGPSAGSMPTPRGASLMGNFLQGQYTRG